MILASIDHLLSLPRGQRLMGIDLGSKTIGLALSDAEHSIATPLLTLKRGKLKDDAPKLKTLIEQHIIAALVIGLPLNMDGSEGPSAQSVRAFVRHSYPLLGVPFLLWDERLSTAAVTRTLLAADASRARRTELVDKMAAAYILQGALDRLNVMKSTTSAPQDEDEE